MVFSALTLIYLFRCKKNSVLHIQVVSDWAYLSSETCLVLNKFSQLYKITIYDKKSSLLVYMLISLGLQIKRDQAPHFGINTSMQNVLSQLASVWIHPMWTYLCWYIILNFDYVWKDCRTKSNIIYILFTYPIQLSGDPKGNVLRL